MKRYTLRQLQEEEFGMLKVENFEQSRTTRTGKKVTRVRCRCRCGNEIILDLKKIIEGQQISCGCMRGHRT